MDHRPWIQMKTYHVDDDVCDITMNNTGDNLENIFEFIFKDVQNHFERKNQMGMDFVLLNVCIASSKIQLINSSKSLLRGNEKYYEIYFLNVKNENNECFSSIIHTLRENDRILILNGVILSNSVTFKENNFIVNVCAENKSSVSLFKYGGPILKQLEPPEQLNLSKLKGSGIYSLYGHVKKNKKYTDANYMLLRLQCCDICCVKVYKYPSNVNEFKNISKKEALFGVKYDFASNKVDILVKSPCKEFISLIHNQYIFLDNIKVKNIDDSGVFSLHVKGKISNLKFGPFDTAREKFLRSPTRHYPISNELEPTILPRQEQVSSDKQSSSNIRSMNLNKQKLSSKPLLFTTKQSKHYTFKNVSDSISDDNGNESPENIVYATTFKDDTDTDISVLFDKINDETQKKKKCHINKVIRNWSFSDDGSITPPFNENIRESFALNHISGSKVLHSTNYKPLISTQSLGRPPLFENTPDSPTPNHISQSEVLHSTNDKPSISAQCVGPCRLISMEPNVYEVEDLVSGYCVKCRSFFKKEVLLRSSEKNYKCPKCSTIVQLSFFFKMIFLHGENERQAIEVFCYNENAEYIFKKLSKKQIYLEDYLSNDDNRKLIISTIKSLISKKTKVNIVVEKLPIDNSYKILKIDTKYVTTTLVD